MLILAVTVLARKKKFGKPREDTEDPASGDSGDETILVDEIYYADKSFKEAQKRYEKATEVVVGRPLHVPPPALPPGEDLIQNWPYISEDGSIP